MSDGRDDDQEGLVPDHGTVMRAPNGDVIRYDPTGLVLRLSDRVIADIALRLEGAEAPAASPAPHSPPADAPPPAPASATDADADTALADVDAWGAQQRGDWLHFTARLPGRQGTRGFRRHRDGGAILGDGPGPVLGLLALGGPRAALTSPGAPEFPHHVLGPDDDIGAVGQAGIDHAAETDRLAPLRECTHEALVADTLLAWQMEAYRPLPLFFTRAETDTAPTAADLATGPAFQNLMTAAQNLKSAAARLGKPAKIKAVCLDFAWEHVRGDATAYRDGMLAVMARVEQGLAALGYDKPLFVARFESGLATANAEAVVQGQWELSWNHGEHALIHSAPGTMFAHDRFDRPTDDARREMAEMTAAALSEGCTWRCPTFLLAEWEAGMPGVIRVTAQAETDLHLDDGAAPGFGFAVTAAGTACAVREVRRAGDDPKALLITVDAPPGAADPHLSYAVDGPGGVHDDWRLTSATGRLLRRYALPARLPVHGGAARA